MSNQKFVIALPGYRARGAGPSEVVLSSDYPNPKISVYASPPHAGVIFLNWHTAGLTVPVNTARVLCSFPHNYNFVPTVFGSYIFDDGSATKRQAILPLQYGGLGIILLDADEKNINLKFFSFDGVTTIPEFTMQVRFYVMAEHGYE